MRKLVVFLFPSKHFASIQEEYLKEELGDREFQISDIFDKIISKRYKDKGFEFAIAQYKDEEVSGITINPDKMVFSNANYKDFYRRDEQNIKADYNQLAISLHPELYDVVVVGGYHSTDCVLKLTSSINSICGNTIVDIDLTNDFINNVFITEDNRIKGFNSNFDFSNANIEMLERFNRAISTINPYNQKEVCDSIGGINK